MVAQQNISKIINYKIFISPRERAHIARVFFTKHTRTLVCVCAYMFVLRREREREKMRENVCVCVHFIAKNLNL